jgi:hypothetical protein
MAATLIFNNGSIPAAAATLAAVLAVGNTTSGASIEVTSGDNIDFDNGGAVDLRLSRGAAARVRITTPAGINHCRLEVTDNLGAVRASLIGSTAGPEIQFTPTGGANTGTVSSTGALDITGTGANNVDIRTGATGNVRIGVIGTQAVDICAAGNNLGFHGAAAVAKQAVAGAKAGNAALTNLLTALATLGLITDSTT